MPDEQRSGDARVAARVLERFDALVERLGEAYKVVPEYATLPDGVMEHEVLPVSREIIGGFLRAVAEHREPAVEDVEVLELMGRRRLEMGVPLEPILHVYRIAGREVFDEIVSVTGPGETAELASIGRSWMDYIDRASSVAATGYLRASHERLRRIDAQRGAVLDALLAAADASDLAAVASEYSVALAEVYVPVLVSGPEAATRLDALAALVPGDSLSGHRGGQVLLLVPEDLASAAPLAAAVPGATVAHGSAAAPGPELAAEVRRVERLLTAALRCGRPGVHGPDDLVLEQLVLGEPRLAGSLRHRVVQPLRAADRGGLVEATLRSFLATGSVPVTAERELVHPNTVSYRLRRVAERLGLDPRVPDQAVVLAVALLADDLLGPDPTIV